VSNANPLPVLADADPEAAAPNKPEPPRKRTAGSRGRPKRDQVEQRDRELLDHALDHFLEKGFEGTTIDSITASLGMAKRTVYARYGDKMALFKAALQRAIEDWLIPIERLQALETDDLEDTLLRIARVFIATMMSPAGVRLMRITNAESYRLPEIGAYIHDRGSRQVRLYLCDLFRRRLNPDPAEIPDLEDLAAAFLHIMSAPARLNAWGMVLDEAEVEKLTRQRVRIFLRGVLPR
jgi:AcrR family transcriptional regulator